MIYEPVPPMKQCRDCGQYKPLSEFYKHNQLPDGHYPYCADCYSIRRRGRPRIKHETAPAGFKLCISCQQVLPISEFWKHTDTRDKLRPKCKACTSRANGHTHRPAHKSPEGYRFCPRCKTDYPMTDEFFYESRNVAYCRKCEGEYRREKSKTVNYAIKRRAREHNRYVRNRIKILARQRDYMRSYRKKRKGMFHMRDHRRRTRQYQLPVEFDVKDWMRAVTFFNGHCAVCGRPQGLWHKLVADHWIPIADPRPDNPGTVPDNIVPLCHGIDGCNNSKSDEDPVAWLIKKFGKRKAKQIVAKIEAYFEWVKEQDE